jgi:hypothetical protein
MLATQDELPLDGKSHSLIFFLSSAVLSCIGTALRLITIALKHRLHQLMDSHKTPSHKQL